MCDYVEIFNGDGSLYGIYCAGPGKVPTYIDSKDSELVIRFRTDCFTKQHTELSQNSTEGGRLLFSYQSIVDEKLAELSVEDGSDKSSDCFVYGQTYSGENDQDGKCLNWDELEQQRYHSNNYRQWKLENNNYRKGESRRVNSDFTSFFFIVPFLILFSTADFRSKNSWVKIPTAEINLFA